MPDFMTTSSQEFVEALGEALLVPGPGVPAPPLGAIDCDDEEGED